MAKRRNGLWMRSGLTIVLLALFVLSLAGQAAAGHREANDERAERGQPPLGFGEYLAGGHFLEAVGENWESEFLQMLAFVWLTTFLYQRGSPESKDPDAPQAVDRDPRKGPHGPETPWPARRGGFALRLYENSFGLAFFALFIVSFAVRACGGRAQWNDERAAEGLP